MVAHPDLNVCMCYINHTIYKGSFGSCASSNLSTAVPFNKCYLIVGKETCSWKATEVQYVIRLRQTSSLFCNLIIRSQFLLREK